MATSKPSKKAGPAARKRMSSSTARATSRPAPAPGPGAGPLPAPAPPFPPRPAPCSKTFDFFTKVSVGPGQAYDSGYPAKNIDCYQWLHVWVLAEHPMQLVMQDIRVELVFELTGKMGATGLVNFEIPYNPNVTPTALECSAGQAYGGFVIRAPVIGPAVRAIVINSGPETYDFSVWGYVTH